MSVDLWQRPDGGVGLVGTDGTATSGFVGASAVYNASSVDFSFFVADRSYRVVGIRGCPDVAGTDAGAVTAIVRKVPTGTALTSGTALHSSTFNLKGTAATNQVLTVSTTASDLVINAGDRLALDFTGVLTSATGVVTVNLAPA